MNHRNFVTSGGASHYHHIMLSSCHEEARNQAKSHQEESDLLHYHHHQQHKSNSCGTAVLDQQYQQLYHVISTAPGSSSRNNCSDDSIKRGPFDVGERRRWNNMTLQEGESWRLGTENQMSACSSYNFNVNVQGGEDFMALSTLYDCQQQQLHHTQQFAFLTNTEHQQHLLHQFSNINNLVAQQQNINNLRAMNHHNGEIPRDLLHHDHHIFNSNGFISTDRNVSGAMHVNVLGLHDVYLSRDQAIANHNIITMEEDRNQIAIRRYQEGLCQYDATTSIERKLDQDSPAAGLYSISLLPCSQQKVQHSLSEDSTTRGELNFNGSSTSSRNLEYRPCDAFSETNNKRAINFISSIGTSLSSESESVSSRYNKRKRQKKDNDKAKSPDAEGSSSSNPNFDVGHTRPPMFPLFESFSHQKEDNIDAAKVLLTLMNSS